MKWRTAAHESMLMLRCRTLRPPCQGLGNCTFCDTLSSSSFERTVSSRLVAYMGSQSGVLTPDMLSSARSAAPALQASLMDIQAQKLGSSCFPTTGRLCLCFFKIYGRPADGCWFAVLWRPGCCLLPRALPAAAAARCVAAAVAAAVARCRAAAACSGPDDAGTPEDEMGKGRLSTMQRVRMCQWQPQSASSHAMLPDGSGLTGVLAACCGLEGCEKSSSSSVRRRGIATEPQTLMPFSPLPRPVGCANATRLG